MIKSLDNHVYLTRTLLQNIQNGNGYTVYKHTNGPVSFGPEYVSITDCSGYINALLEYSYDLPLRWADVRRSYASTYYKMIREGKFFYQIDNISDAQIGDFIVFRIPPNTSETDNTGHIMMINNLPEKIRQIKPIIDQTDQYAVQIIDQSSSHGSNDSRFEGKKTGLGLGYIRIYTKPDGTLKGYTWSLDSNSKYMDTSIRPLIIGRFRLEQANKVYH